LAMENAKFVHDGKEVSLEEAYKILHLDKVWTMFLKCFFLIVLLVKIYEY
jgi:hypothetical protein